MKKYLKYLISFLIPIMIMIGCFSLRNIFPFGKMIPRMYDSYYQYTSFYLGIKNFGFYSFNTGLGFNFFATATYYLMSPINLLFLLANYKNIDLIFVIVILIKIGLTSLNMNILLNSHSKRKITILFSVIYALSGFMTSYYYNIMWLDSLYMLPLVIMGINRIFEHKSSLMYILTLSLTIIFNFYTGYMVGIFSILYFIFSYINYKENKKGILKRFIFSTILSVLITSFILLPAMFGLLQGKASGYTSTFTKYRGVNNNAYYFFNKLGPGSSFNGDQISGPAQIYSSVFAFIYLVLIIFNKEYDFKYKISVFLFILIYILSFFVNVFDYAWQFMQRPVWWPHRYSFTLSFLIIYLAFKNYLKKDKISLGKLELIVTIISIILLFIVSFGTRYHDVSDTNTKIILVFMLAFSILLILSYLLLSNIKMYRYFLIALVLFELCINSYLSVSSNVNTKEVKSAVMYSEAIDNAFKMIKDDNFYRAEVINKSLFNEGLMYGYNGVNYFNSVRNQNYVNLSEYYLMLRVDSHCSTYLNYFDPILLSLLDIKYLVGSNVLYYDVYKENNSQTIYENQNNLSIGYLVNDRINSLKLKKNQKFDNLTAILNTMTNKDTTYYIDNPNKIRVTVENGEYIDGDVDAYNRKENVYVHIIFRSDDNYLMAPVNQENYRKFSTIQVNDNTYNFNGTYIPINKDDVITINLSYDDRKYNLSDFDYKLLKINEFTEDLNILKENILKINNQDTKHLLSGEIEVKSKNEVLFFSIPYEDGFTFKVDGKKVPYEKTLESFITIKVPKGKHTITVDYVSKGFKTGLIISISSFLIMIIYLVIEKHGIIKISGEESEVKCNNSL